MTSGVVLAAAFYRATVRPILDERFPDVAFMVGRLGSGSDVLGYDDARSTDHDWGCRLTVLVPALDAALVDAVDETLEADLPDAFEGRPVRFPTTWDPRIRHKVQVNTLAAFVASRLGVDATEALSPLDWLVLTGQSVLEITAPPVFSDPDETLGGLRHRLAWYPDDVWLYVLGTGFKAWPDAWPRIRRTVDRQRRHARQPGPTGGRPLDLSRLDHALTFATVEVQVGDRGAAERPSDGAAIILERIRPSSSNCTTLILAWGHDEAPSRASAHSYRAIRSALPGASGDRRLFFRFSRRSATFTRRATSFAATRSM